MHIENTTHPITRDIADFNVIDETYQIGEPEEPGNTILISTDNKTSMKTLSWTREYKNSRVFCYASGHDGRVYKNESYRKIINRALHWSAGRI